MNTTSVTGWERKILKEANELHLISLSRHLKSFTTGIQLENLSKDRRGTNIED